MALIYATCTACLLLDQTTLYRKVLASLETLSASCLELQCLHQQKLLGLDFLYVSALQGIGPIDFLSGQAGYDVCTALCSPLNFWTDSNGDRTKCLGAEHIRWGAVQESGVSDLDVTAEIVGCWK